MNLRCVWCEHCYAMQLHADVLELKPTYKHLHLLTCSGAVARDSVNIDMFSCRPIRS